MCKIYMCSCAPIGLMPHSLTSRCWMFSDSVPSFRLAMERMDDSPRHTLADTLIVCLISCDARISSERNSHRQNPGIHSLVPAIIHDWLLVHGKRKTIPRVHYF